MYEKIKSNINEPYYQQHYSNDGERFVAWYLKNIHLRDMNETKDDMIDGANDKQIDAILIDDDKQTAYMIQGKFIECNTVDAKPLREVLSSWMQLRNLENLQQVGNSKLQRKLSELAKAMEDEYEIAFELITTGELTDSAKDDLAIFQESLVELSENENFNASIFVIDNEELKRRYDLALEQDNPVINHEISISEDCTMELSIAGDKVVIAALPLKECIKLPGIKDGTIFRKNVRQSLGLNNRLTRE